MGYGVTVEMHSSCSGGADVELITLPGALHSNAGVREIYRDKTYMINTTEVVWQFLAAHPAAQGASTWEWEGLFELVPEHDIIDDSNRTQSAMSRTALYGFLLCVLVFCALVLGQLAQRVRHRP